MQRVTPWNGTRCRHVTSSSSDKESLCLPPKPALRYEPSASPVFGNFDWEDDDAAGGELLRRLEEEEEEEVGGGTVGGIQSECM